MKRLSLFLLFSFFISTLIVNGQEKDTLSLKSFEELSQLVNQNFQRDSELSESIINYYIDKAKSESNVEEEINGLAKYIDLKIKTRKFDAFEAQEAKMYALVTTDELEEVLAENIFVIGYSYFFQGLIGESIKIHSKALELARKHNKIKLESAILTQLGYVKSFIGDHNASVEYQKEALALNRATGLDNASQDERRLSAEISSLYFISRSYINSKIKDSALAYVNEAIEINKLVNDSCLAKALYRTKGEVNILFGEFEKALSNFETSKTYCLPLTKGDSLLFSGAYGKAYIGLKQYEKAQDILQRGIDDYGVAKEEEGFMDDHYKLLAKAYKYNGNIEKSNFYFEKYIHTTEEFNKLQDTVVSVFKNQELKEFEAELEAINSKKDSFKYIVLASGLVILILLFFLFRFNRQKKANEAKFNRLLEKMNTKSDEVLIDTKDNQESTSEVSDDIRNQIIEGLKKLEEQEYFLRKECNSYNVAKKIKTNTSYLSKVVNSHYQKNFNTYINDLRINYAIVKLKNDSKFRKFSIQSIAEDIGYKSADSFTKYFKKQTGLNPSFFIKKLNDLS